MSSPPEVEAAAQKASHFRFGTGKKTEKTPKVVTADSKSSLKKDITALALTLLPAGLVA